MKSKKRVKRKRRKNKRMMGLTILKTHNKFKTIKTKKAMNNNQSKAKRNLIRFLKKRIPVGDGDINKKIMMTDLMNLMKVKKLKRRHNGKLSMEKIHKNKKMMKKVILNSFRMLPKIKNNWN